MDKRPIGVFDSGLGGLTVVKKKFKIPVFEVISKASQKAIEETRNVRVGVIGTRATINSHAYKNKIKKLNSKIKVFEKACPLFVPFIEEGETTGRVILPIVRKYLVPLKKQKIDTLVLGCTHYSLIARKIKSVMGPKVKLVGAGRELALYLKSYLAKNTMLNNQNTLGQKKYFVSDLNPRFLTAAEMFLGQNINKDVKKITLE